MNRIILKVNTSGSFEVFTSLQKFFDKYEHTESQKNAVRHVIVRKKGIFSTENYQLLRVEVNAL